MKNENGQALIFVIATMTVALAVGVGVSLRNLSSISRTSRTDTYSRVQAAAEGGIENFLAKSDSELQALVGHAATPVTFSPTSSDNITSIAQVTVEYFNIPLGLNYLPVEIKRDKTTEVKLDGGAVTICWSSQDATKDADIYYVAYNNANEFIRRGVASNSRNGFPAGYSSGGSFAGASGGNASFSNCHNASLPSNALGIRIKAINSDIKLGVYPASGSLPNQGYLISSIGQLQNISEGEEVQAEVTVARTFPYAPAIFDYSIFSGSDADVLR